ncbi:hypothetical protein CSAL01_10040 [Colletotrichum salicis]|uniref:Uncharacterized protein n=1 Tax=Colletotrichum salicis TaxID=1209931 RepID=A0A135U2C2_9PEZI|nr:hypothetical protein CSAL01_10040 [Colletotrichum salicis]
MGIAPRNGRTTPSPPPSAARLEAMKRVRQQKRLQSHLAGLIKDWRPSLRRRMSPRRSTHGTRTLKPRIPGVQPSRVAETTTATAVVEGPRNGSPLFSAWFSALSSSLPSSLASACGIVVEYLDEAMGRQRIQTTMDLESSPGSEASPANRPRRLLSRLRKPLPKIWPRSARRPLPQRPRLCPNKCITKWPTTRLQSCQILRDHQNYMVQVSPPSILSTSTRTLAPVAHPTPQQHTSHPTTPPSPPTRTHRRSPAPRASSGTRPAPNRLTQFRRRRPSATLCPLPLTDASGPTSLVSATRRRGTCGTSAKLLSVLPHQAASRTVRLFGSSRVAFRRRCRRLRRPGTRVR